MTQVQQDNGHSHEDSQEARRKPVLSIRNLKVFSGEREIIHGIDLDIAQGERFGLIGESGSGKSLTCLATMGLLPHGLRAEGTIQLSGSSDNLLASGDAAMRKLRGKTVSMVFQEPMTALNPLMTVGRQISEAVTIHHSLPATEVKQKVSAMLESVGLADTKRAESSYPFQMSGGQRQRVMLAMAMINKPQILLADEPTTALDVTVQRQVTDLMAQQVLSSGSSLLFITHDLGVVAGLCTQVAIMRHGRIVEQGKLDDVFANPQHPYTKALLAAAQLRKNTATNRLLTLEDLESQDTANKTESRLANVIDQSQAKPSFTLRSDIPHNMIPDDETRSIVFNRLPSNLAEHNENALEVSELVREYRTRTFGSSHTFQALKGISFDVHRGEKFGIVGESGCGKSTTLCLLGALDHATTGSIKLFGREVADGSAKDASYVHKKVQVIFQDPMGSLDPRMRVWQIISEPLKGVSRHECQERSEQLLTSVGLDASCATRYPHQFSGGQRQRIAIARALITKPEILLADEAVSALDVSVRAQVLNLLADLAETYEFTLVFVSHDLHVVRNQCDVVAVMHAGRIVECGPSDDIYRHPQHPYTKKLLAAMPSIDAVS